jgi:hypothetical protein
MGFVDAVLSLADNYSPAIYQKTLPRMNSPPKPPKPFMLPKANINNDRAYAYLRGRGIGKAIINRCIDAGILYENINHNCVFVGKDGDIPKFACERGTDSSLKKDISGSDKRYSFSLPPTNSEASSNNRLAVFESPIDAIAHHEIYDIEQIGWDGHRLSLGGTSSLAIVSFLERHPEITNIHLCLDNDRAGREGTKSICNILSSDKRFSHIKITITPPPIGKDFADTLEAIQHSNIEKPIMDRPRAFFSI